MFILEVFIIGKDRLESFGFVINLLLVFSIPCTVYKVSIKFQTYQFYNYDYVVHIYTHVTSERSAILVLFIQFKLFFSPPHNMQMLKWYISNNKGDCIDIFWYEQK